MKRIIFIIVSLFVICTVQAKDVYEVTASRLNVRVAPSIAAPVIGGVQKGDLVEVLQNNSTGWAKIKYKKIQGYVNSNFLRVVKARNKKNILQEDEGYIQPEKPDSNKVDQQQSSINSKISAVIDSKEKELPTLLNGPGKISNNFELYYGLSAGLGYSSFLWDGDLVNGKLSYNIDIFSELYFKNKVSFVPNNYFLELQLGFDGKGAAWYPMSYFHTRLFPCGYKFQLYPIKFIGKAGLYLGVPLNDLESYNYSQSWSSNFQVGISAAVGVEYKQFCVTANFDYGFTKIASAPQDLNNMNIYCSIAYKLGKIKH